MTNHLQAAPIWDAKFAALTLRLSIFVFSPKQGVIVVCHLEAEGHKRSNYSSPHVKGALGELLCQQQTGHLSQTAPETCSLDVHVASRAAYRRREGGKYQLARSN